MIHELRIYTVKPLTTSVVAKNAAEIGRAVRGDDFGKLEGYWMTDIGPLNQVVHLWSYKDLNERERLRSELAKNERWNKEYVPLIRPYLVRQDIRLLTPVIDIKKPERSPNVYEFRYYRLRPGTPKEWVGHFITGLPHREKYSKIAGLWQTEAGQPNEVCHLWAYPDLNTRTAARDAAMTDSGWQEFLKHAVNYLEEMNCMIMLPAAHSPLK